MRVEIQTFGGVGGDRCNYIAPQQIRKRLFLHIKHSQIRYLKTILNYLEEILFQIFIVSIEFFSAYRKKDKKNPRPCGCGLTQYQPDCTCEKILKLLNKTTVSKIIVFFIIF